MLMERGDYDKAYDYWSRMAKEEFNRPQIVETAADHRDYSSPIWWAMQDELQRRDAIDLKRYMRRELKAAKKRDNLYKTPKSRLKNQRLRKGKMAV